MRAWRLSVLLILGMHCWGRPDSPSCEDVCARGRSMGCPRCESAACESTCAAEWSDDIRRQMLSSPTCRWSLGGSDTFALCASPH